MKKLTLFIGTLMTLILLNGCQGGYDDYGNYDNSYSQTNPQNLTTLFLVDANGMSYANIPYKCDSMRSWSQTAANGEFSFIEPEQCEFNFNGLDGIYGDMHDDVIRIVDYTNDGKGGIPYDCANFRGVSTYDDGSFDYDQDDVCTFYL
ncbi:MAG: hypothetical protein L3J43_06975 [Sulfurovum sp.]|nr:hypothetical protein [Sulfurovum sp.]